MKPINIEKLMNHSVGISDSYYRDYRNEMLEDYVKAIDFLTINDDKITLQKQVAELTEKSKQENYIIKGKLADKEKEIQILSQRDSMNTDAISSLSDQLTKVMQEIEMLKNKRLCTIHSLTFNCYSYWSVQVILQTHERLFTRHLGQFPCA